MADPDFIERLQSGRDAMRKLQRSVMRLGLPVEQRQAFVDTMGRLMLPGDQLQAIIDMIDAFGPPLAQVKAAQEEIAAQREDLERMQARLATLEASIERLALASEQLVAMQGPFVKMAELVTGQKVERSRPIQTDDTSAADTPNPTSTEPGPS